jgi:nanoRNase/pAp phosphatase (c-di-AMP/oligoRNAs hydrolase)
LDEFKEFSTYVGDRIIILGHINADLDVLGSAQGVKELTQSINRNAKAEILLPSDISTLTLHVASYLDIKLIEETHTCPDTVIVVDTGGINQLGAWWQNLNKSGLNIIFIDHHLPNSEINQESSLYILDSDATSTSEIVYQLLKYHKVKPSKVTAEALLAGITYDTRHFSMGGSKTFRTVSELLEVTGDVSDIKALLSLPMSTSEKIARLKVCKRSEIIRTDEWIIVISRLSSFQSSGARALISLGADLAVVVGKVKGEIRASMRSTSGFYRSTLLHLGDLSSILGKLFNGSGSGHATAAGLNAVGGVDLFILETQRIIIEELEQRIR